MLMRGCVGVEISARRIDDHMAQKARGRELVQRVVNCRQRNTASGLFGFLVQEFGSDVPIFIDEKQAREKTALPCWAQPCRPQSGEGIVGNFGTSSSHCHGSFPALARLSPARHVC
jgi:hypothetical protein